MNQDAKLAGIIFVALLIVGGIVIFMLAAIKGISH